MQGLESRVSLLLSAQPLWDFPCARLAGDEGGTPERGQKACMPSAWRIRCLFENVERNLCKYDNINLIQVNICDSNLEMEGAALNSQKSQ